MFRAKDTICITMQISIIKWWQFIFPGKERKMFSVQHSFCAVPFLIKRNQSSWSRFVVQIEWFVIIL